MSHKSKSIHRAVWKSSLINSELVLLKNIEFCRSCCSDCWCASLLDKSDASKDTFIWEKKVFPRHVKPFEGSSLLWKKLCHPRTWSCRVFDILTQLGTCIPALQMVKTPKKAFVKRRQNFKGDWTHLLSITFKQTDKICCCNFRRVTKSGDFLLVQSLQCLFFFFFEATLCIYFTVVRLIEPLAWRLSLLLFLASSHDSFFRLYRSYAITNIPRLVS